MKQAAIPAFNHLNGSRFATILDVVNHYDSVLTLALTDAEKADLVEYRNRFKGAAR